MNRLNLIKTLDVVGRGLVNNNVVPMFGHYCFTGTDVLSFNDGFGLVAPCSMPKPFTCHGRSLVELLRKSSSDEVEIIVKDEFVAINAGSSNFKLPYKSDTDFLWKEPSFHDYDAYPLALVVEGLKTCLTTCSSDVALGAFNQICLGQKGNKQLVIYSCNGDGLTKATIDVKMKKEITPTCISRDFAEVLTKVEIDAASMLFVGNEWVCATIADGAKVYGRSLGAPKIDYEQEMKDAVRGDTSLADIPPELDAALSRARVVADEESSPTNLNVSKGLLRLSTITEHLGNVKDLMSFNHPTLEVDCKISAALIQEGLEGCECISFTENCTVMQGENVVRVIGNMG
jgi:DNA polymerase III sliding clamp (beta) subunit (PCNA family)